MSKAKKPSTTAKAKVKVEKKKGNTKTVGKAKVAVKPKFGDGVGGFLTEKIVATMNAKKKNG